VDIIYISYINYIKFILFDYKENIEKIQFDIDIFEEFNYNNEPYPINLTNYVKNCRVQVIKRLQNIPDKYFLINSNEYDEIITWMNNENITHKSFLISQLNNYL